MLIDVQKIRFPQYDLKNCRASVGRNLIHDYPAMLHSKVVESLLNEFSTPQMAVYDPFCGSGTTIVQSLINGNTVYGTDINPLALLIAKVRSSNIDLFLIERIIPDLLRSFERLEPDIPAIKNDNYWFKDNVKIDLGKIRTFISRISYNDDLKNFFLVCFSTTVRYVSNNRNSEFKRFRLSQKKLEEFNPNTLEYFVETVKKYHAILCENEIKTNGVNIYKSDIRFPVPFSEKIDLVITSPPYGDSKTTVAYGQYSSFSLEWLKGLNPFGDSDLSLDNLCLGGKKRKDMISVSPLLNDIVNSIFAINSQRALDVNSFFYDLFQACKNICKCLKPNAKVCFVVGNRTVKGIQIPLDIILIDFFEHFGLNHIITRVREISNKRMPAQNSPTNIPGLKSPTMHEEYVLIFNKEPIDEPESVVP